jgi:phospholipid/cholesterol/gamma-HCH transport system permease protein
MPSASESSAARIDVQVNSEGLEAALAGDWHVASTRPSWIEAVGAARPARVRLSMEGVGSWDSSLLLLLTEAEAWCRSGGIACDTAALPEKVRTLLAQLTAASAPGKAPVTPHEENFLVTVGVATRDVAAKGRAIVTFVGECTLGLAHLARRPGKFRWRDCFEQMQQCGAMALPIVSLISVLVGLTLAYQAAVELRQFGADIYVADLVGLSIVREMGPMMTAVILAGRTGAAFAATLGNMRANEEIDALQVLGISPVAFLVMPRLVALAVMMPLLALYSNGVGIIGGMLVGKGILQIPPSAYWIETAGVINLHDITTGLIKATTFGLLIGFSGCLCGLRAAPSAAGVGRATTSAVVTALLLIIVADALFAVIFNLLHI